MNEPYRLRYTNQIVGAFLLVILLFLIAVTLLFLRSGGMFAKRNHYWMEVDQDAVADLHQGAEVMILGEHAGLVESIHYVDQSNKVRINLSIDPRQSSRIFEDSIVFLERKYGVGTPMLVIRRASNQISQNVAVPSGSQLLNFRGEVDRIEQMAEEVQSVSKSIRLIQQRLDPTLIEMEKTANRIDSSLEQTINPAFVQTGKAFDSFYETNETLRPKALETLESVKSATTHLELEVVKLTEKMDQLIESDMKQTLAGVRESTGDISGAAKQVSKTTVSVNEEIAKTLAQLSQAAKQVENLATETRELVRVVRSEANELPGTTAKVNDTVSDTQDLVGEIRSHWLLRNYSTQNQPTSQLSPSTVRGGGR